MFCPQCGKYIEGELGVYCPWCGKNIYEAQNCSVEGKTKTQSLTVVSTGDYIKPRKNIRLKAEAKEKRQFRIGFWAGFFLGIPAIIISSMLEKPDMTRGTIRGFVISMVSIGILIGIISSNMR